MICEALLALHTTFGAGVPDLKNSARAGEARDAWKQQRINVESLEGARLYPAYTPPAGRPPVTRVAENILGSCAIQAKAYEQCAEPWPAEAEDPDAITISPEPAARVAQLKRFVSMFNTAAAKAVRCDRISRAARAECAGGQPMARANAVGGRSILRLQTWQSTLMENMIKIAAPKDAPVALNCLLTPREGVPVLRCYALDPDRVHTRVVTEADADALELTVGLSNRCTFVAMPDGRLLTAEHCGPTSLQNALLMRPKAGEPVVADFLASLKATAVQLYTGAGFEDLAVWRSRARVRARPFYILAQDPNVDRGCRVQDDLYLACAPSVYPSLNSRRGTLLGFPTIRYTRRLSAESVIQSRGDIIFDRDTNRLLLHVSISPGSSGGPTYLDAGETVGGVTLDRPLYLGPVTNVNRSRKIDSEFSDDTQVVVGVYELEHLRAVLNPPPAPDEAGPTPTLAP